MIHQGRGFSVVLVAMAAALLIGAASTTPSTNPVEPAATQAASANRNAVVIELSGEIDDANRDALFRRFREARRMGVPTVILDINTYGGLVTSGLDISRFLKQQDDVHVIAYVGEKAISAGVMIALAADEIVMAQGAMMGDSAPISVGPAGMESLGDAERAKAESPILADFYESAVKNGYDPLLTQAMVSVGRSVYWIENDAGERKFVDEKQYKNLVTGPTIEAAINPTTAPATSQAAAWRPVPGAPNPVDDATTLLTVHTDLAKKLGLASGTATSPESLAAERGLSVVATLTPSGGERLIGWLDGGIVRFFLFLVF